MMSINQEGSLYDDQGVEPFHKHLRPRSGLYQGLKLTERKAIYPGGLISNPDRIALSTVTSLLSGLASPLVTSQAPTPSRFLRGEVTVEQDMYARGFLEALDDFHASGNRQPEALAPGNHKLIPSTSGMNIISTMAGPVLGADHFTGVSSSHFISGHNHSMEAVAPTYVTATMDFQGLPSLPHPSQSEPSSIYASAPQSYVNNTYTPPILNFPSVMDTTSYGGYSSGISSHTQHSGMNSSLSPQMVKELSRVVPADIKTQEHMKVERKKARNRIAASKCRQRRLQHESDLHGKVSILKDHNQDLNNEVSGLRVQISNLKKALVQHMKGGCRVNLPEGYGLRTDSSSSE